MSGAEDQGVAAAIGAAVVAVGGAIVKALRRKRPTPRPVIPPTPQLEHSAASARIGAIAQRLDHLEKEQTVMRHETAQRLADLHESIDELKVASATTTAVLPRVEKQLEQLAADLREERRRPGTNRD